MKKEEIERVEIKISPEFVEYVNTINSLCDIITWEVTKDVPAPSNRDEFHKRIPIKTPLEIQAYHSSREYKELKKVSVTDQWLLYPTSQTFSDLSFKACCEAYWQGIRKIGISEATITRIEERYEKFQLEVQEFKKHRAEGILEVKKQIKEITAPDKAVTCQK